MKAFPLIRFASLRGMEAPGQMLMMLLAFSLPAFASDPSSAYNVDGQVRSRTCAPLALPMATLRFPDGTPTGFFAYGDDPSKNGSAADCTTNSTEIDAQELLDSGIGMDLYFRPGGGPDQYVDPVNKGQYGHIWSAELASHPAPQPLGLNGHPCNPTTAASNAFPVNLVGAADDGAIYACNLSSAAFPPQFVLYRWANEAAVQRVVYSGDPGNGSSNASTASWGDSLAARGAGTNTQILIGAPNGLAAILRPADASMSSFTATTLQTDAVGGFGNTVGFGAGNTFWSANGGLFHFAFDLNSGTATTLQVFGATNFPASASVVGILNASNLLAALDTRAGPDLVRLYDIANLPNPPVLLDRKTWVVNNENTPLSGAAVFGSTNLLYVLDSDNGIMAFSLASVATNPLPPSIILAPASQEVSAGSDTILTGAADGSQPIAYQWQFNSTNLNGATAASLNLSAVSPANAGNYRFIVTNLYGADISAIANLSVTGVVSSDSAAYEPFAYPSGSALSSNGSWLLNSGASGTIQPGSLVVPGMLPALSNHFAWTSASMSIRLPIGPYTNADLYFSFTLKIGGVTMAASDTLAGFTTGTGSSFAPKINAVSNSPGAYNLGIYKSTGLSTGALATNLFRTNDLVFVVARYRFNDNSSTDDTCDLWLNPPPGTFGAASAPNPSVADVGLDAGRTDIFPIDRFFFRSASSAAIVEADELRVGRTWASVTPTLRPALSINAAGGPGVLRWPTNAYGYSPQETTNLAAGAWMQLTNVPATNGTNNSISITITNGVRFYRLVR